MASPDDYQTFNKSVVLAVGDATKEVQAAPGAGKSLYIRGLTLTIVGSAAQTVDVESSDGVVELIKAAASLAAGTQLFFSSRKGFKLPDNTSLRVQPAAAGVVALVVAEGYTLGKF